MKAIEASREELEESSEEEEEEAAQAVEEVAETEGGHENPWVGDCESEISGFESDVGSSWISLQGHEGELKTPSA